jgi:hypothetical protein
MDIEFVAVGAQVASATSPATGTLPTGYAHADMFLAQITSREDSPTPVHGITTDGVSWTQIGTTQFLDLGTTGIAQSLWYRFARSASESAPSVSCPTPNGLYVTISAWRNIHSSPLDVAAIGGTNAAATTLQPNGGTGITTATNKAWVLSLVSTSDDNALDLSTANGFTDQWGGANYDTDVGGDASQGGARIEKTTAGNQTAPTHRQTVLGSDSWAWHLIALRPLPDRRLTQPVRDRGNFINAGSF